ncbi:MAG: 16S rRNA (guanine(966)-N(2))-methyltransferase RsmD [Acidobacteria bacterium]|nr:16S rRNA (guanine(966)-N(2))-methyltransferase RsmD [Acidobacteriota bacterium]
MRIIAGTAKGRRLHSPDWPGLRPTSDRLRGTLFDILGARVYGAAVLDGCAGTGAVGIEALSRGAVHVDFVERDARAVALIRRNVDHCQVSDRCTIHQGDLLEALHRDTAPYDLILLDPPYGASDIDAILSAAAPRLAADGLVVLERARRTDIGPVSALESLRQVRAGDSVLEFFGSMDQSV